MALLCHPSERSQRALAVAPARRRDERGARQIEVRPLQVVALAQQTPGREDGERADR